MSDVVLMYRGRPLEEMSKDELIQVLKNMDKYWNTRESDWRAIAKLSEARLSLPPSMGWFYMLMAVLVVSVFGALIAVQLS